MAVYLEVVPTPAKAGRCGKPSVGRLTVSGVFPGRRTNCGDTAPRGCQRLVMRWLGAIRQGFERDRRCSCTHADGRRQHHHHRASHPTGLPHHAVAADARQRTTTWSRFDQRRWPGSPDRPAAAGRPGRQGSRCEKGAGVCPDRTAQEPRRSRRARVRHRQSGRTAHSLSISG